MLSSNRIAHFLCIYTATLAWALPARTAYSMEFVHELLLSGGWTVEVTDPHSLGDDGSYMIGGSKDFGSGFEYFVIYNGWRLPRYIDGIEIRGGSVNSRGDWLATEVGKTDLNWGSVWRMIKNGEVLDHGWSSDFWWGSGGGYLSKSGKAVWTNGTMSYQYVVVDGVNYSDQWSDGYWDYSVDVLSDGTPVWYGRERGHSQIDPWIGGVPVSRRYDLGEYDWRNARCLTRRWVDVNDAGRVAWLAAKVPDGAKHVFKGDVDLSEGVSAVIVEPAAWINEAGHVLWGGALTWDTPLRLFLDGDLHPANSVLEPNQSAVPYGLNDADDVLWLTASRINSKYYYVYVNHFNLTKDAFGPTGFLSSQPLAFNNAGQVLWTVNTLDGKWSIYLSTPVPEPWGAALVAPALLLMAIARRSRSRRGSGRDAYEPRRFQPVHARHQRHAMGWCKCLRRLRWRLPCRAPPHTALSPQREGFRYDPLPQAANSGFRAGFPGTILVFLRS